MKRFHLWIEGRVQGNCFRHFTNEEARRLGVSGWVRNLSDGRVEVVVEGTSDSVERLIEWCRQGPPHARVDGVEVREEEPTGTMEGFQVSR